MGLDREQMLQLGALFASGTGAEQHANFMLNDYMRDQKEQEARQRAIQERLLASGMLTTTPENRKLLGLEGVDVDQISGMSDAASAKRKAEAEMAAERLAYEPQAVQTQDGVGPAGPSLADLRASAAASAAGQSARAQAEAQDPFRRGEIKLTTEGQLDVAREHSRGALNAANAGAQGRSAPKVQALILGARVETRKQLDAQRDSALDSLKAGYGDALKYDVTKQKDFAAKAALLVAKYAPGSPLENETFDRIMSSMSQQLDSALGAR